MDNINKLIESLKKGGKPAQTGEIRVFAGREFKKMGNGEWVPVVHPEQKQLEEMESKKEMTPKQSLEAKLKEKTSLTVAEKHLHDMKNGVVLENKKTRSGKPVFVDVDHAIANAYRPEDFREVGNMFYDRADKLTQVLDRMEQSGSQPEKALNEIKELNLKLGKQFLSQANRIESRNAKTASSVAKSVVMMGHADAAEIETSNYSIDAQASKDWLEYFHNCMDNYNYGDSPRELLLDSGTLYLVKVEEGLYTGVFKSIDKYGLEDNAKVRIERMTLPSLIQFCKAKEWIKPIKEVSPLEDSTKIEQLNQSLVSLPTHPVEIQPIVESDMDKRIRILELISKLIG